MGLMVYAVCRTGAIDPAELPTGCRGGRVHAICTERTTALFSPLDEPVARASEADFASFDGVIARAHALTATLPIRFGAFFSDDGLLSRAMRHADTRLVDGLQAVDGRSEVSVTIPAPSPVVTRPARVASPAPVEAAFEGSAARSLPVAAPRDPVRTSEVEPQYVLRHHLAALHEIAERVVIEDPVASAAGGLMRCMVRDQDLCGFREAFEDARQEHGFVGRIGEPSPCYHFATHALA